MLLIAGVTLLNHVYIDREGERRYRERMMEEERGVGKGREWDRERGRWGRENVCVDLVNIPDCNTDTGMELVSHLELCDSDRVFYRAVMCCTKINNIHLDRWTMP